MLIGGEAGVGKTTLARELCQEAAERGALVLGGSCYDLSETPPYGPWSEAFSNYQPEADHPSPPAAFARTEAADVITTRSALFEGGAALCGDACRASPAGDAARGSPLGGS